MSAFLAWAYDRGDRTDIALRAALAHLWFVTIHPFDDGNGRIARAAADWALARSENGAQRFYGMSAQIRHERNDYYDILSFLACLGRALSGTEVTLGAVLHKVRFWKKYARVHLLSGVRERPCIVHDSGRRTIRLPAGLASGCTGQQRVDDAASLLVFEFVQHGTNERAQLGSRHRLEGSAEIRVSRSNTRRAETPTDHYSVLFDASDSRAGCTSVPGIESWLVAGLNLRSSIRVGSMPRAARLALLAVTFATARRCLATASATGRKPRSRACRPDRSWSP